MKFSKILMLSVVITMGLVSSSYGMCCKGKDEIIAEQFYVSLLGEADLCGMDTERLKIDKKKVVNCLQETLSRILLSNAFDKKRLEKNTKRLNQIASQIRVRVFKKLNEDDSLRQLRVYFNQDGYDELAIEDLDDTLKDAIYDYVQSSHYKKACCTIAKGTFFLSSSTFWLIVISGLFYPESYAASIKMLKYCGIPLSLFQLNFIAGKWLPMWLNPVGSVGKILGGLKDLCFGKK